MTRLHRGLLVWLVAAVMLAGALPVWAGALPAPDRMLYEYVDRPDTTFGWEQGPVQRRGFGTITDIALTSQTWRGIPWKHVLRVFQPAGARYPGWMTLWIVGGSQSRPALGAAHKDDEQFGIALARAAHAPVALLYQVPNQPLFGDLYEDEIISLTFKEYLKDHDATWPLLFPMVKSAVRAMDTLQAWSAGRKRPVRNFIVMGLSKRGWTTWLTAAYDSRRQRRVKAIMPCVIDTLNFFRQFAHQKEMWGAMSEEISDYTSKGLTEMVNDPVSRGLWQAVDPYTYRQRITIPKLLVHGANDPYWTTDALNLYWDGLVGPKYVLYAPNSGHDLDDRTRVINAMSAFYRTIARGQRMPAFTWTRSVQGRRVTVTIKAPEAVAARAWVAKADNLDFRPQKWESVPMQGGKGVFTVTVLRPADKNMAVYGEADFYREGKPFSLSTQQTIARR